MSKEMEKKYVTAPEIDSSKVISIDDYIKKNSHMRVILHKGFVQPISIMNQDNEAEMIKMKKTFNDAIMYLNTVYFDELPNKEEEIIELVDQLHSDSASICDVLSRGI